MVTNLPGRARHPLQKTWDLHVFPNWQAFPGVRETSDRRKTRNNAFPSGFFAEVLSPHPYRLLSGNSCTVVTRQQGERGRQGHCIITDGASGPWVTDGFLFSFPPPSLLLATHTANGEELSTGQTNGKHTVNGPRSLITPLTPHLSSSPGRCWDQSVQDALRGQEGKTLEQGRRQSGGNILCSSERREPCPG